MSRALKSLLLCLAWLPVAAAALSTDAEQPIEVEADSLELRDADGLSIYEGNVLLVQGSLEIRAERLEIHFDDARELDWMRMTGAPARFRQLDDEQREMRGEALRIDYRQRESELLLSGTARFDHAGDSIESEQIRIHTETNEIQAGGNGDGERVKMLIQPRQDNGDAN